MAYFLTRKILPRRTIIRGGGASLSLPLLDAMLLSPFVSASDNNPKVRVGFVYVPHGATMSMWTPKKVGKDFPLSPILSPLSNLKKSITVLSNLGHPLAYGPGGATGNHNRSSATFLSGAWAQSGPRPYLGITIDQVVANSLGGKTPIPSLELMIEEATLNCGEGLNCAYRNTISWQTPQTPLPMQNNPQVVFEQLFGDGSSPESRAQSRKQSLSLLDAMQDEIKKLDRSVSATDRHVLDQYLTQVREVERRISQSSLRVTEDLDLPERPSGIPSDVEEHILLMYELLALAWQTEITRVGTFLVANELSNAVYSSSGIRDAFHVLSHHSNNEENKSRFGVLNTYHIKLFSKFLEKLASMPDGENSLLENSMILYGSGMSDGNSHNHDPLPIILAGNANNKISGNNHLSYAERTPMSNLLLSMLKILGIDAESFGDSNGTVELS